MITRDCPKLHHRQDTLSTLNRGRLKTAADHVAIEVGSGKAELLSQQQSSHMTSAGVAHSRKGINYSI